MEIGAEGDGPTLINGLEGRSGASRLKLDQYADTVRRKPGDIRLKSAHHGGMVPTQLLTQDFSRRNRMNIARNGQKDADHVFLADAIAFGEHGKQIGKRRINGFWRIFGHGGGAANAEKPLLNAVLWQNTPRF